MTLVARIKSKGQRFEICKSVNRLNETTYSIFRLNGEKFVKFGPAFDTLDKCVDNVKYCLKYMF